jgi:hypothetical protein
MKMCLTYHGGTWYMRVTDGEMWYNEERREWQSKDPTRERHTAVAESFALGFFNSTDPRKDVCLVMELPDAVSFRYPPPYLVEEGLEFIKVVHRDSCRVVWSRPAVTTKINCKECGEVRMVHVGVSRDDRIAAHAICQEKNDES